MRAAVQNYSDFEKSRRTQIRDVQSARGLEQSTSIRHIQCFCGEMHEQIPLRALNKNIITSVAPGHTLPSNEVTKKYFL